MYPGGETGERELFAVGSIIVKSSPMREIAECKEIGYAYADANEVQAREILRQLHDITPVDKYQIRSHFVSDPDILTNGRIQPLERDILFSDMNHDPGMNFMHNDLTMSNLIVDDDKIVGLIDWEMAGLFGWRTAGEVHRKVRPHEDPFWKDLYEGDVPNP
ncbi:hypothetical protein N7517_000789 [Penicillium concentricum]|uniref:non-specific serine/threonine protein kinase n=1 Tax=Penicillium concentricum TaxID=293559 RepID=A0A9W9SQN5_9EURO|nr:uncharacterized protein N7517_000789 [Penicillium concentricum]KAJ5382878.1 hypothetical protein N7517_000789 [Penicillium concentricum]